MVEGFRNVGLIGSGEGGLSLGFQDSRFKDSWLRGFVL